MALLLNTNFSIFLFFARRTETVINRPAYKSTMRLTINNVQKHDYGMYKCVAKNPRGETDGTIRLYCKYRELSSRVVYYESNLFAKAPLQ